MIGMCFNNFHRIVKKLKSPTKYYPWPFTTPTISIYHAQCCKNDQLEEIDEELEDTRRACVRYAGDGARGVDTGGGR
jgi:hypothetical protein